ncbi:hypothetical protein, partial ['Camptotheca acuminata' phytoplasma]|uniref:hypothetical protein n=1 Tax='Camptotheca acuminata' phytoplasma TaxID=3239192 RepID=UPI00351A1F6A
DSDMNQVIEPLTTAPTANNEPSSQIPSQTVEISDSDMNQVIEPLKTSSSTNEQKTIREAGEESEISKELGKKFKEQQEYLFEYKYTQQIFSDAQAPLYNDELQTNKEKRIELLYNDELQKNIRKRIELLEDFPEAAKQQFVTERNIFFISFLTEYYNGVHKHISNEVKPQIDRLSQELEEELKQVFNKFSDIKEIFDINTFLTSIKYEIEKLFPQSIEENKEKENKTELDKFNSNNNFVVLFEDFPYNVIAEFSKNYIINIQKLRIKNLDSIIYYFQTCIEYENIETIQKLEYIKKMYFKFIYMIQLLSQNEKIPYILKSQYYNFLDDYKSRLLNSLNNLDQQINSIKVILKKQQENIKEKYNDISEEYRNKLISELDITLSENNQENLIKDFLIKQNSLINNITDIYKNIDQISILVKHLEDNKLKGFVKSEMEEFISEYKSFETDKRDYELYFRNLKTNLESEKQNKIFFFDKEQNKLKDEIQILQTNATLLLTQINQDSDPFFSKQKEFKDNKIKSKNKEDVLNKYEEYSNNTKNKLNLAYNILNIDLDQKNSQINLDLSSSIDKINSNFQNNFDKQMINFISKLSWEKITENNVPYYISRIQNEVKRKIDEHLIHLRNVKIDFLEKMTYMILDYEIKRIDKIPFDEN